VSRLPLPIEEFDRTPASTASLINCYVEQLPEGAKGPVILTRAPGIETQGTIGNGPVYEMLSATTPSGERLYSVSGSHAYITDSSFVSTDAGSIGAVSSAISMAANTDYVVIVNQPDAYALSLSAGTLTQITDADFTSRGASKVRFVDNWLLFLEPDSGRFFGADVGSATSFDALNFATAEAAPDNVVGMEVDHRQVILFGEKTIEIWENTGVSGFPFERVINGFVEIGCFNGDSVAKCDNSVFWLANDYTVRRLNGVTPVRVSTHGIEKIIQAATISTARGWSYSQGGHLFYVLSFNEATVVYDATTGKWHQRKSYGYDNWTAGCHASVFGYELVGSSVNSNVGSLESGVYTYFGDTQLMSWRYQPIYNEARRAVHDELEVVMKTGVGITTGQGSDPQMMMRYSDDSGITWESLPNKGIGAIGRYNDKVRWNALGSTENARVYEGSISDPVEVQIVDTQAKVRGGRV
jgi:hypothetical protein